MMIHDTVDAETGFGRLDASAIPHRSPARMLAEGIWYALWHAAMAALAAGAWVILADAIRRERCALDSLDKAALQDIGIDRANARAEARRHWTDLPIERRSRRTS